MNIKNLNVMQTKDGLYIIGDIIHEDDSNYIIDLPMQLIFDEENGDGIPTIFLSNFSELLKSKDVSIRKDEVLWCDTPSSVVQDAYQLKMDIQDMDIDLGPLPGASDPLDNVIISYMIPSKVYETICRYQIEQLSTDDSEPPVTSDEEQPPSDGSKPPVPPSYYITSEDNETDMDMEDVRSNFDIDIDSTSSKDISLGDLDKDYGNIYNKWPICDGDWF